MSDTDSHTSNDSGSNNNDVPLKIRKTKKPKKQRNLKIT